LVDDKGVLDSASRERDAERGKGGEGEASLVSFKEEGAGPFSFVDGGCVNVL
jgi:hypothetical protein